MILERFVRQWTGEVMDGTLDSALDGIGIFLPLPSEISAAVILDGEFKVSIHSPSKPVTRDITQHLFPEVIDLVAEPFQWERIAAGPAAEL